MKKFFVCRTEEDLKNFICKIYNSTSMDIQVFEREFDITINHTGSDEDDTFEYDLNDFDNITPSDFVINDLSNYSKLPFIIYVYLEDDFDRFGRVQIQVMDSISFEELGIKEAT